MNKVERFTEQARRAIFFARNEAARYGNTFIDVNHLLLGVVREEKRLFAYFGISNNPLSTIRAAIETRIQIRDRICGTTEIPLTEESKRILRRAAKEADKLRKKHIQTGHLLVAILGESTHIQADLESLGFKDAEFRAWLSRHPDGPQPFVPPHIFSGGLGDSRAMARRANRPGIGYDLHRLESGRKLVIGGIEVPFDKGSVGHSDGDVLAHAICDALIGAAGLGDIGTHFPDTDPKWKGADSLGFLKHIRELYDKNGLQILHIDSVVILERPKLGPHFPAMREAIAKALGIEANQINLKAKTNEGVDAVGRGEAIAAHAVATIAG